MPWRTHSSTTAVLVAVSGDSGAGPAADAGSAVAPGAILDSVKAAIFGASSGASVFAGATDVSYVPRHIPCINTTSATFAIWLNVLYLAPLTYLFASFFVAS